VWRRVGGWVGGWWGRVSTNPGGFIRQSQPLDEPPSAVLARRGGDSHVHFGWRLPFRRAKAHSTSCGGPVVAYLAATTTNDKHCPHSFIRNRTTDFSKRTKPVHNWYQKQFSPDVFFKPEPSQEVVNVLFDTFYFTVFLHK
jgi:hypothetical protein